MMKKTFKYLVPGGLILILILAFGFAQFEVLSLAGGTISEDNSKNNSKNFDLDSLKAGENKVEDKVIRTEEEWKKLLSDEEFNVLRNKGTERAFTGEYNDFKEKGIYYCAACGNSLFSSDSKYDSGSGWPSYWAPIKDANVELKTDISFGMHRKEVLCAKCGSHLGHVFDDGPKPTNLRYCINSVALDFEKKSDDTINKK